MEERFDEVLSRMDRALGKRDLLQRQEKEYENEVERLREEIMILEKVEELYKFVLDKYVNRYAESFSALVTEGMQAIFYDQDISFEVQVGQKHGKVWLDFVTAQGEHRGMSLESFGGGVASVQSLLLRLLVLLKKDLARYLILDESLAALSEEYVGNAGQFIKKMCEKLGVNVLLITHNKAFLEYADHAYQAGIDAETESLVLQKI